MLNVPPVGAIQQWLIDAVRQGRKSLARPSSWLTAKLSLPTEIPFSVRLHFHQRVAKQ